MHKISRQHNYGYGNIYQLKERTRHKYTWCSHSVAAPYPYACQMRCHSRRLSRHHAESRCKRRRPRTRRHSIDSRQAIPRHPNCFAGSRNRRGRCARRTPQTRAYRNRARFENPEEAAALPSAPSDRTTAQRLLLDSGLWAQMRQRPYGIVPPPGTAPRDIFVTTFDSAPLAPDWSAFAADKIAELNAGVSLLRHLTDGDVYVGVRPGSPLQQSRARKS